MKQFFKYAALLMLFVTAIVTAHQSGADAGTIMSVTPVALPVLNQTAEREMIKKFRHENSWLAELTSKNNWVNQDIIKIPKQGTAPNVLINNTIYPIVSNGRDDSHVVLSLNKYDTENTFVTEDELYALPYEKVSDVQVQHREELEDVTAQHALHSMSPNSNTATTPVLVCTGAPVGGRPTLTSKDMIAFKEKLDKLKVPKKGRILIMCTEHVSDLLNEDRVFYQQYHNAKDGVLTENYYGFKIYESTYNPTYTSLNVKVAFGAVDGPKVSSICIHKKTCFKATGSVKRFARLAENDPENRRTTVGFRLWFIGVAIRDEGIGALIS